MTMTREKMKESQSVPSNPRRFFRLNREAVVERATETLIHLAALGEDPATVWHAHLAPLDKHEKSRARGKALEKIAAMVQARLNVNGRRTSPVESK